MTSTSIAEHDAIQVAQTICGVVSMVVCAIVAQKIYKERTRNVTNNMLLFLFAIDIVLGLFYAIGRGAIASSGFCQFQALIIQWFSVAAFAWMCLMSYIMYQWIVRKKHPKRMEKTIKRNQIAIMVFSFLLAIILLGTGVYGDAYLWCWITSAHEAVRVGCFEIILLASWFINLVVLYEVRRSIHNRMHQSSVSIRVGNLLNSNMTVQKKLMTYVGVFTFVWFFALLDRFVEYGVGHAVFPVALLHAIVVPLQGFFNAVVYADFLNINNLCKVRDIGIPFLSGQRANEMELKEVMIDPTSKYTASRELVRTYIPKKYSIFTTTFNMGEAPMQSMYGDIKDWIVEGHDVYAIGVQECIDLQGVREFILDHLGGASKYAMYNASIGSGNTSLGYHGFIAITVFVKVSELQAGHIQPTVPTADTMATGADLIITTAQNKGAVGVPLQIHDTNIGFVTCHLPSDSKGKSKLTKRNASAHSILKEVILAPEDLGFDLHLQHDHILVFGDLNYRMDTSGAGGGVNSLTGVAVACTIEKQELGNDPNWLASKYNMLRHHLDPLHPSIEVLKMIHSAKAHARGAWSSVLRADELRSIMDDGDAFFGFEEPMPCFPPSYKRRKGAEADCGDYTDFKQIIRGYSNTGEVENHLEIEAAPPTSSNLEKQIINSISKPFHTKVGNDEIMSIPQEFNKSPPKPGNTGRQRSNTSTESAPHVSTEESQESTKVEGEVQPQTSDEIEEDVAQSDSNKYSDNVEEDAEDTAAPAGGGNRRNRRAAVLAKAPSKHEVPRKKEIDPSKLRPPSYTDRILVHSLPDRQERVTVQAYDFCDTMRVSDHRAVSMTMLLEVNSAVVYSSTGAVKANEHMKEPRFELYELTVTNITVSLMDLLAGKEDEEDEDADDLTKDIQEAIRLSNSHKEGQDEGTIANPLQGEAGVEMNQLSKDSNSSQPPSRRMTKKKSFWKRLSVGTGLIPEDASTSSDFQGKAKRKKSVIASFFTSTTTDDDEDNQNSSGADSNNEEDDILKEMGRESMDWKNQLHQPGEWRKKVMEEERKHNSTSNLTLSLKLKKKKKSENKVIHQMTIVFPLPVKDPLIVHRRIFDYAKAFDAQEEPVKKKKEMSDLEKNE